MGTYSGYFGAISPVTINFVLSLDNLNYLLCSGISFESLHIRKNTAVNQVGVDAKKMSEILNR